MPQHVGEAGITVNQHAVLKLGIGYQRPKFPDPRPHPASKIAVHAGLFFQPVQQREQAPGGEGHDACPDDVTRRDGMDQGWLLQLRPDHRRRLPPVQGLQGARQTGDGIALLPDRQGRPHQVEALAAKPPQHHPRQAPGAPRGQDAGMRDRGRERFQQRRLADQAFPVTAPAHPQHRPAGEPGIVRPALGQDGPSQVNGDGWADDLQPGGRIVHAATARPDTSHNGKGGKASNTDGTKRDEAGAGIKIAVP